MKKDLGAKALLYPTPVLVVGTYDSDGKPNAMTAAWGGICCSVPPCVTISLRKATYSYGCLMASGAYTLNIPSVAQAPQADYFGLVSGRDEDKFVKTGLTPVKSNLVSAPYIEEFAVNLECKIVHTFEIGLHTQFVGEILNVKLNADIADSSHPVIEQLRPFIYAPDSRLYYELGEPIGKAYTIGKAIE